MIGTTVHTKSERCGWNRYRRVSRKHETATALQLRPLSDCHGAGVIIRKLHRASGLITDVLGASSVELNRLRIFLLLLNNVQYVFSRIGRGGLTQADRLTDCRI